MANEASGMKRVMSDIAAFARSKMQREGVGSVPMNERLATVADETVTAMATLALVERPCRLGGPRTRLRVHGR